MCRPLRLGLAPFVAASTLATLLAIGTTSERVWAQSSDAFTPITDAMLQDPSPDDWLMWRRTLDGWGYSPLDQINRDNVDQIRMVWSRGLVRGSQEGTPIAYGRQVGQNLRTEGFGTDVRDSQDCNLSPSARLSGRGMIRSVGLTLYIWTSATYSRALQPRSGRRLLGKRHYQSPEPRIT